MTRIRFVFNVLAITLVLGCGSVVQAQAVRTWVSGVGDDANPCSRTAPCKNFSGAIVKTASSGEIDVLDPGHYGTVTITKSITIDGGKGAGFAGITASAMNGIVVQAGENDIVILRNISINGINKPPIPGLNGIRFLSGRSLRIEDSHIVGFSQNGIDVVIGSLQTLPSELVVVNTTLTDITGVAIRISAGAGAVAPNASLSRIGINRAQFGVDVQGASNATLSNSVISNVTAQAAVAENTAVLNVVGCVLTNNGTGVSAFTAGTTVRVANSDIFNIGVGVNIAAGATGQRFGNSRIIGNGTDILGVLGLQVNQ
jgi:hypothetical protein